MRLMQTILKGALAGLLATAPMTAVMAYLYKRLPWWEQRPLPPHTITSRLLRAVGLRSVDEKHHQPATWTNHFAFGATAGMLYPLVYRLIPLPPLVKSVVFGVGVWLVSYLGWLPITGLLRPATQESKSRNALMIAAHMVWGAITGLVFQRLPRREHMPAEQPQAVPASTM